MNQKPQEQNILQVLQLSNISFFSFFKLTGIRELNTQFNA